MGRTRRGDSLLAPTSARTIHERRNGVRDKAGGTSVNRYLRPVNSITPLPNASISPWATNTVSADMAMKWLRCPVPKAHANMG